MSIITKQVTENCGLIWEVETSKISYKKQKVLIQVSGYDSQEDLDNGKVCRERVIQVSFTGYDGSEAWCLNALKNDSNSELKDGVIS